MKKFALNSQPQPYQILTNDDQLLILYLSYLLTTVRSSDVYLFLSYLFATVYSIQLYLHALFLEFFFTDSLLLFDQM